MQVLLDPGPDLLGHGLDQGAIVGGLGPAQRDGVDRLEEADLELGRQVGEHPERAEPGEGRRDREVDQAGQLAQEVDLGEDGLRLLGADDADRDDLRLGPHRDLDEAAAAEAAQAVAVLVELLGPLAALGEDEDELAARRAAGGARWRGGRRRRRSSGSASRSPGYPLKKCSTSRCSGRGSGCSSLIALAIIAASGGSAPEWLETSRAPPSLGTFSMPSTSARNQSGSRSRRSCGRRSPRRARSGPSRRACARARSRAAARASPRSSRRAGSMAASPLVRARGRAEIGERSGAMAGLSQPGLRRRVKLV